MSSRFSTLSRRSALLLAAASALPAMAKKGTAWPPIEAAAKSQTVYFNDWAGSEHINSYLQWAAAEMDQRHGVKLVHVKIADTAEAVKRVRDEKAAGKLQGGKVDMVWINGANFSAMKREGLLFGPFAESLPNFAYVDVVGKPSTRIDFSEPVNGMEAPWGMAQLTFKPNEAANEIAEGRLAASVYGYQYDSGTIGNTHFLAIPFNAAARQGAQVAAYFFLSPEAQARKADTTQWGDPTVLAVNKLAANERALFTAHPLPGEVDHVRPALPEPHASWVEPLAREWLKRYGQ